MQSKEINNKNNFNYPDFSKCTVAVIGLGYVGLPLALELAKRKPCFKTGKKLKRNIIGFDINKHRIDELQKGYDRTKENVEKNLLGINLIKLTTHVDDIAKADVFIITVPTPIDEFKKPNLSPIKKASLTVSEALKRRKLILNNSSNNIIPIVIYESTVYPGTTQEICIPLIENKSGFLCDGKKNRNSFGCGYSPERINPGDKNKNITDIVKVTSGSSYEVSKWVNDLYSSFIKAGTHMVKDIKIAEAAKIIENTQRDINIALINELSKIFKLLEIDTLDVIKAASTKWNFLEFKPGLVGGHCIGVDPYYLTYKAESIGYSPEMVLAGRRINDGMADWIGEQLILEMDKKNINVSNSKILILGFAFKENCTDVRNTKVYDLAKFLMKNDLILDIMDPWIDSKEVNEIYQIDVSNSFNKNINYDVVISAVAHKNFVRMTIREWKELIKPNGIFFDLKGIIPRKLSPIRI
tara:strand:- start:1087 stop:2490 length:1404 start_codon:yes stop_codon:yes gene_type:complete